MTTVPDELVEQMFKRLHHRKASEDATRIAAEHYEPKIAELKQLLSRAEWFISSQGYRRCDIAACNCPYWHGGNASSRLTEITDALRDAGCHWEGTILKTLEAALLAKHAGRAGE